MYTCIHAYHRHENLSLHLDTTRTGPSSRRMLLTMGHHITVIIMSFLLIASSSSPGAIVHNRLSDHTIHVSMGTTHRSFLHSDTGHNRLSDHTIHEIPMDTHRLFLHGAIVHNRLSDHTIHKSKIKYSCMNLSLRGGEMKTAHTTSQTLAGQKYREHSGMCLSLRGGGAEADAFRRTILEAYGLWHQKKSYSEWHNDMCVCVCV